MANSYEADRWQGATGRMWLEMEERITAMLRPHGAMGLLAAAARPGEHVLDVGCGTGPTTIALADAVGTSGSVVGLDVAQQLLDVAETRREGRDHVRFVCADAQVHAFDRSFDLAFSRFGVMFFDDPIAAFANLAAAVRPGGRLTFVCWQRMDQNPWNVIPAVAAFSVLGWPELPAADAPGPFAFADPDKVRRVLTAAGFGSITVRSVALDVIVGTGPLDELASVVTRQGPMRVAGLTDVPDDLFAAASTAVAEAIAPYETPVGVVMPSATWLVTATRP